MRRKHQSIPSFMSLLLLLLTPSLTSISFAQPSQGDWIVTGSEAVKNKSIILNGNLVVKAGGNLTLSNVTLTVNNQYRSQYGISVEQGGSMFIIQSKIAPSDLNNRFTFVTQGSNFVMKNSELRGVGWCRELTDSCYESYVEVVKKSKTATSHLGLLVETGGATIEDSLISDSGVGTILAGSNINVKGNTFRSNDFGALLVLGSQSKILSNTISHVGTFFTSIIRLEGNENTIAGNKYTQESATWPPFEEIYVIWSGTSGSNNNIIANNTVNSIVPAPGVFPLFMGAGSNNIIVNNTSVKTGGICLLTGANNRIERNTIPLLFLQRTYNTIVANNRFSGRAGLYGDPEFAPHCDISYTVLALDHSSNNFVLDNVIETEVSGSSLLLWSSKNNTIQGNRISNGWKGIFLYYESNGNKISNNEVRVASSKEASVITVDDSSSNVIYENNFMDENGILRDNGNNTWSHQGKGNYWSSHTGRGNVPYKILPNGVDSQPLASPIVIRPTPMPDLWLFPIPLNPNTAFPIDNPGNLKKILIENKILDVRSGSINIGDIDLTIRNSTLILGRSGYVQIYVADGTLTIERSRLIADDNGYGFTIRSGAGPVIIKDSEIHGAVWSDRGIGFDMGRTLIVENSIITSSRVIGSSPSPFGSPNEIFRIVNNTFVGNYQAIQSSHSKNVFISGNVIHHSLLHKGLAAIQVTRMKQATIANNVILRSWGDGIDVYQDNIVVVGNTISNVVGTGLVICCGATIYRNNFINNTVQVSSKTQNYWSYNGTGNYWSDYKEKDGNLDGIGDTPYVVLKGPKDDFGDSFPFMQRSGWLGVANSFEVAFESNKFTLVVRSNSSISSFSFSQPLKQISFEARNKDGKGGASELILPKKLLGEPYTVGLDGKPGKFASYQNETHVLISVEYTYGSVRIEVGGATVIPEFPSSSLTYLLAVLLLTTLVALLVRRERSATGIRMSAAVPVEGKSASWLLFRVFSA